MNLLLQIPEDFKVELTQIIREVIVEEIKTFNHQKTDDANNDNNLLNLEQACEFLNCSKTTLYHYRRKGIIEYHQVGRKLFFKKNNLLKRMKAERL